MPVTPAQVVEHAIITRRCPVCRHLVPPHLNLAAARRTAGRL